MKTNIFNRLSFLSLFLVIVLLPVFFLPFTNIPAEVTKGVLLVVGLAVSLILWALARFYDGKIVLPKSWLLASGGGVVLACLLSALFSGSSGASFFGTMFDVGSFWFIFSAFLLMLISAVVFRNPGSARMVLFGVIAASAVVLVFQCFRFFMPELLSLSVLGGKTDNIFGSWNAFGIFAGFSALMSLLVIEFFPITMRIRWMLQALIVLSLVLIAAVNLTFVWEILGISSLIIFVYKVSSGAGDSVEEDPEPEQARYGAGSKGHFPTFSFTIMMVTLLFFMSGQFIGGILPNRLGLLNAEVSPSFVSTAQVAKSVLKKDPVFGLGPNRFTEAWAMYKPEAINNTQFWDVAFNSGSGLLPTLLATTGYLSILAWLVFFVLFLIAGVQSVFLAVKKGENWETMAFFVLSLYLFISCFFYSSGPVLFLLALAFAGIFTGLSAASRENGEISMSFLSDNRKSFFSILFLVLLIIFAAGASFKYVQRFVSVSYFNKALRTTLPSIAETSIGRALSLHQSDLYLRTYSQIYLVKLNELVAKGSDLSDEDKASLQASVDQAVNGVTLATVYNPINYLNFQALGSVYQSLAAIGVKETYEKALAAFVEASRLNPLNPRLKLSLAAVLLAQDKTKEAKKYASEALALKGDYVDALITLSQIAKSEGNNAEALSYAQTALSLYPNDENLKKYVESLKSGGSTSASSKEEKKP